MFFLVLPKHENHFVTWESGLDKVSSEIQGVSSTDYNFKELSRPWIFILKFNVF